MHIPIYFLENFVGVPIYFTLRLSRSNPRFIDVLSSAIISKQLVNLKNTLGTFREIKLKFEHFPLRRSQFSEKNRKNIISSSVL